MVIEDSASGGAVVGEYVLTFDDTREAGGTLATVTTVTGGPYDPATGAFSITADGGPIEFNIGVPGQSDGMTQLSDDFTPVRSDKNGSAVGILNTIEVDADGMVYAIYDNGQSKVLYQIPVVDVPNPNGLRANMNQTFRWISTAVRSSCGTRAMGRPGKFRALPARGQPSTWLAN